MEVLDCIGMCVLGQMRHKKSILVRRIERFRVYFWAKQSTKGRDACDKMEVLGCILRKCV